MHNDAITVRIPKEIDEYLNRIVKEQKIKKSTAIRMIIAERMMKDEKRGRIKPLTKDTPRNKRTRIGEIPRTPRTGRKALGEDREELPKKTDRPERTEESQERDYFADRTGTDFSDWTEEEREQFEKQFGKQ